LNAFSGETTVVSFELRFTEGNLCLLEPFDDRCSSTLIEWLRDPQVVQHLPSLRDVSAQGVHDWIESFHAREDALLWSIISKHGSGVEREFAGIAFLKVYREQDMGIGGTIIGLKRVWGKGLGAEVKGLQLRFAFEQMGLKGVFSLIYPENLRAKRLLLRCGYQRLHELPDYIQCAPVPHHRELYFISRSRWAEFIAPKLTD
jgi:RimJ/RimL family protein N-acetyltransferase